MALVKFSDHVLAAGNHASRPAAADTPVAALFACTTHDTIYRSDGVSAWSDWIVAGGGGGIAETLLDAKGDLVVASAADTAARLAVGGNGDYPRAASGASTGIEWQKNNLAAAVAPVVGDDSADGYTVGSRWIDTTADKEYVCLDASVGAAIWTETTGAGGGASAAGYDIMVYPPFVTPFKVDGTGAGTTGDALMWPIHLAAPMKLRALGVYAAGAGAGTHKWGLFDASVDATAAVKVAGGSGAIAGAGWRRIAADSAPVDLPAGGYVLILQWPASGAATINANYVAQTVALPPMKSQGSFAWDDTPNLTSGWTSGDSTYIVALIGDLDASGNQW